MRAFLWNRYLKLFSRRCRGCSDRSEHTDHLTWLGRWHYTGRFSR